MTTESTKRVGLKVALTAIIMGAALGMYYYLSGDSRAIAYHRARLLPQPGINDHARADQDALIKLGWLVRRDVHLSHQTIKTNAALEVFAVASAMNIELKEPAFFGVLRADPEKPAEITVWAYRGDMPAVERIIAGFDSQVQ
jgi:hypothetical protein